MSILMSISTAALIWTVLTFVTWVNCERKVDADPYDTTASDDAAHWFMSTVISLVLAFVSAYVAGIIGLYD